VDEAGQLADRGSLDSAHIPELAAYDRQFVQAYAALGIPIAAITLQNEPEADNSAMPSCVITPEQEAALAIAAKQQFAAAGLATKVWIYDHNFDHAVDYSTRAFATDGARAAIDGVAFHDYAGDPSAIASVAARFPEQAMVFTEKTLWGVAGVARAAEYFRNGSISYVSWLTLLDQDGKPNNGPNSDKPRRFVRAGDGYWATPEHFLFGLYSRLVAPGARRIASDPGDPSRVTDVAFQNPDGTIVVIVANQTAMMQPVALHVGDRQIADLLDAHTAAAYTLR
jgi:glucosylceramidase